MSPNLLKFYHGTDVYSALDILNNGLNAQRLLALQKQPVQLGAFAFLNRRDTLNIERRGTTF
ncbi:hypothetical protein C7H19_24300 [Aphanothece hegewaldii CCALA 016]|uniref:Uncharacterized protein n=1 Tax=Aphanothece hegewaldii CCALA 016 TaxID=2107694 RepID=A0A2T1LQQ7_9CHRO|nr:hypothetical protein [Aphanothece hegewaldii]PSF29444.1 hypothetical protein C7H19_24300 [Aphanothece hegewaldii CCALA 016]